MTQNWMLVTTKYSAAKPNTSDIHLTPPTAALVHSAPLLERIAHKVTAVSVCLLCIRQFGREHRLAGQRAEQSIDWQPRLEGACKRVCVVAGRWRECVLVVHEWVRVRACMRACVHVHGRIRQGGAYSWLLHSSLVCFLHATAVPCHDSPATVARACLHPRVRAYVALSLARALAVVRSRGEHRETRAAGFSPAEAMRFGWLTHHAVAKPPCAPTVSTLICDSVHVIG